MQQYTPRLTKDKYVKQHGLTHTDKLTAEDIEDLLEDYKQVDDIYKVPLQTHLRYFTLKDNKRKFRMGGWLAQNTGLPKYVILSNGKNSWSVQVNNTIFFKKMKLDEIKEEYDNIIDDLEKKNADLLYIIKQLKNEIKELKKNENKKEYK